MRKELVERLLSAAQMVVGDKEKIYDSDEGMDPNRVAVDKDIMADLEKVVQEISDDAVREIEKIQREAGAYTKPESCRNCRAGACCNCGSLSPWRCGCSSDMRCSGAQ